MKKSLFLKSLVAVITMIGIISSSAIQVRQVNADTVDQYIKRVCLIAEAEIGTKETGTNHTKYAEYFDKNYPKFYGDKKQNTPWCDIFVDWCFVQAFGYEAARRITYQKSGGTSSSTASYNKYKNHPKTPQPGDQIFYIKGYDSNNKPVMRHTGLVVGVKGKTIYTIEGNTSEKSNVGVKVMRKTKTLDSSMAFGRPDYEYLDYTNFVEVFYKEITRKTCSAADKCKYADELKKDDIKTTIVSVGWKLLDSDGVRGISNDEFVDRMYKALVGTSVDSNKKKHLLEEIKYMNRKAAFEEVAKSSACRDYLKKKGLFK